MADSGQVSPLQSTEITRSLRGRLAGGIAGFPRAVRAPHRDFLGRVRHSMPDSGFQAASPGPTKQVAPCSALCGFRGWRAPPAGLYH